MVPVRRVVVHAKVLLIIVLSGEAAEANNATPVSGWAAYATFQRYFFSLDIYSCDRKVYFYRIRDNRWRRQEYEKPSFLAVLTDTRHCVENVCLVIRNYFRKNFSRIVPELDCGIVTVFRDQIDEIWIRRLQKGERAVELLRILNSVRNLPERLEHAYGTIYTIDVVDY